MTTYVVPGRCTENDQFHEIALMCGRVFVFRVNLILGADLVHFSLETSPSNGIGGIFFIDVNTDFHFFLNICVLDVPVVGIGP